MKIFQIENNEKLREKLKERLRDIEDIDSTKDTLTEMAKKLQVAYSTVYNWLYDDNCPRSGNIVKIMEVYNFTPEEIGAKEIIVEDNSFRAILSKLLEKNNIKQTDFAETLGIDDTTLSNYKKDRFPKKEILIKIANFFEVSIDYLLTGEKLKSDTIAKTGLNNRTIDKCETYKENSAPTGLFDMVSKINEINTVNYIIGQTDFVEKFTKQTEEYKKVEKEYKETNKRNGGKILPAVKDKRNGNIEAIKNNIEKEIAHILEEYVKTIPDEYRELTKK